MSCNPTSRGYSKDKPGLRLKELADRLVPEGKLRKSVYGILEERFSECFGFTEREVHQLLQDNGMIGREQEVKRWYNGYRFGNQTLYNPWSILVMAEQGDQPMAAHWIHTSGNDLIRDLVTKSQVIKPEDLECLLQGQPFVREIKSSVVLNQLTPETVWSLLLYSGYLTYREAVGSDHYDLKIPNLEVRTFFNETVRSWLGAPIVQGLTPMLTCLLTEGEIQENHQAEAEPRYSSPAAGKDVESKARERFKLIVMIQTAQSLRGLPQDSEESLLQWDHAKLIAQAKALGLPTP